MNTSSIFLFALLILFLSAANFSCSNNEIVELSPSPQINASIFHSDIHLAVLGEAYQQYQNTNPASNEIVNFVTDFSLSRAYTSSFLMTKQEDEHIIW